MPYDDLVGELQRGLDPVSVGAFPDGSLDDYFRLRDGETVLTSREAFATTVVEGRDSLRLEHVVTTPGGQAVNVAQQLDALGDGVLLAGHLDHDDLAFPFETVSMGAPARVNVLLLGDDDLLLVERSSDLTAWTFADLRDALAGRVDAFLERDALCCTNWASVPGLPAATERIAARNPDGGVFCIDPGTVTARQAGDLLRSAARLQRAYDVVLSVNTDEANRLAAAAGLDARIDDPHDSGAVLESIRTDAGVTGVVVHAEAVAVAATASGTVSVPNLDVEGIVTTTGAGDRFSAAFARSLAAGWDWELSLAMGNACASHYVTVGETADCDDLRAYVTDNRQS
ncbi:PfkB family carbohydrate kinase [Haloplanus halobius]|uniref:PfkB family carbohydrate kinase n=1 Tax=Haloplanus halobius TaxID=2934938 RepID=UPI00200E6944|nr:PfkB family carbohydrate kinase [Haloplanus sp. XH21]